MILLLSFNWERTSLAFLKGGEEKVTEQCHFLGIRKHTVNRPLGRPQTRWHLGGIMPLSPSACHPSPLAERHPQRGCKETLLMEGLACAHCKGKRILHPVIARRRAPC